MILGKSKLLQMLESETTRENAGLWQRVIWTWNVSSFLSWQMLPDLLRFSSIFSFGSAHMRMASTEVLGSCHTMCNPHHTSWVCKILLTVLIEIIETLQCRRRPFGPSSLHRPQSHPGPTPICLRIYPLIPLTYASQDSKGQFLA